MMRRACDTAHTAQRTSSSYSLQDRSRRSLVCRAAKEARASKGARRSPQQQGLQEEQPAQRPQPEQAAEAPVLPPPLSGAKPTVVREYRSMGMKVIESDAPLGGPEDEKDFWEGESFETFGQAVEKWFIPGLLLLGLVCGGIAAGTYNDGADTFVAPPGSPDDEARIIIAPSALASAAAPAPAPGSD